jgi:hypothetical protein
MTLINPNCAYDISMCVTKPYYCESFLKLEKVMIEYGHTSNVLLIDMVIFMLNENLEKIINYDRATEMSKIFDVFSRNQCEISREEKINDMKKQNQTLIVYWQNYYTS